MDVVRRIMQRWSYCGLAAVDNSQINLVNEKDPQYREWKNEEGYRVSEVQKRKIVDMNSNVIKKPTRSKKDAHDQMRSDTKKAKDAEKKANKETKKEKSKDNGKQSATMKRNDDRLR